MPAAAWFLSDAADAGESRQELTRGPYLQQVTRTAARVLWNTSQPARCSIAWGQGGVLSDLLHETAPAHHHVARLEALHPARRYSYEVRCPGHRPETGSFSTELDRSQPFRVAIYGDTRTNHEVHRAVVRRYAGFRPQLAFHTGDLVGVGDREGEWDNFFQIERPLLSQTPLYPSLGNHEGNAALYLEAFDLPAEAPAAERYYAVRYSNALFLVLDLYGNPIDVGGLQAGWLEEQLAASLQSGVRHRIVVVHHGPFDSGAHGSNLHVRSQLVPLFEHYGVDIVFSGHDHDYERSTVNGVKYVVTGGAGAPLHPVKGDTWTEARASVHHYGELELHGPRLDFKALRLDGSVLDSFRIVRGDDECSVSSDCSGSLGEGCGPRESGAWACVLGGCIWNCLSAVD